MNKYYTRALVLATLLRRRLAWFCYPRFDRDRDWILPNRNKFTPRIINYFPFSPVPLLLSFLASRCTALLPEARIRIVLWDNLSSLLLSSRCIDHFLITYKCHGSFRLRKCRGKRGDSRASPYTKLDSSYLDLVLVVIPNTPKKSCYFRERNGIQGTTLSVRSYSVCVTSQPRQSWEVMHRNICEENEKSSTLIFSLQVSSKIFYVSDILLHMVSLLLREFSVWPVIS